MSEPKSPHQHGGLPLFFAFQDGQVGYDCDDCDGRCCLEASALSLLPRQLEGAGARTELFAPLVSGMHGGLLQVDIGLGGCPALLKTGRCRIHGDRGRRHKPVTCALFPFNILVRTADFCAVVPHFGYSCPLVLEPPPEVAVTSQQEIADDLTYYFGESLEPFKLVAVAPRQGVTLESERRILKSVNAVRGKITLGAALSEASGIPESDSLARATEALALLALDPAPDPSVEGMPVLPMIPALRSSLYHLELPELEAALLVGWQFVNAAMSPDEGPGLRQIASVFARFDKLISLAVQAQRPVRLEGPLRRPKGGIPEVALEVALVLRGAQQDPGRFTLAELLSRHVRSGGVERRLVLQELSRAGLGFE